MFEQFEPEHFLVPINPDIHLPHWNVTNAVVDVEQSRWIDAVVFIDREIIKNLELRQERFAPLFDVVQVVLTGTRNERMNDPSK